MAIEGGNTEGGGGFADDGATHRGCDIPIDHDCFDKREGNTGNTNGNSASECLSGTHHNGSLLNDPLSSFLCPLHRSFGVSTNFVI
jgi:hypothetical protein